MKVVLQDGIKDCGVCSLLSVIRYYGGDVSKEYLRELTNTTKSGVSAYKLIEASEKIGFESLGVTGDIEKIQKNNLPCIAHVIISKKYQHFVVVYEIDQKKKKVTIMDPARGKKVLSFSEFKLLSSNNFIFLHPKKTLPTISNKHIILKIIKTHIKSNIKYLPFIILLTSIYFIMSIILSFHFKYLMYFAIDYNISINIEKISIIIFYIYIFKELTLLLKDILLIKWSQIFDEKLTIKTYEQIILLPYLYFKNRTTGEVISRIKDLNTIKSFLVKIITSTTTDFISIIIFVCIMFSINKEITTISIILSIFYFVITSILKRLKKKTLPKYYKSQDKINSYIIESLASVDAVKGIHIEKQTINRFKKIYQRFLENVYKLSKIEVTERFFKNILTSFIMVFIYGIGTKLVITKKINIGELIIYQTLLSYYFNSITNIYTLQKEYHEFRLSLNRVEDLYTISKENFSGSLYYNSNNLIGNIKYENLTYAYSSTKIFNNLNLTINNGQKILICGKSGSGKSTLVKMLTRYIEVPFGNISINNIDINHYHLNNLRNNITYISQQEFLFTGSIYTNIVMNREIEESKLDKISKITLVNKIIEKSDMKYQKLVEENGFNFSGGERQKIILARALLKESDIYIFDEALNQIDIESEKVILNNIFKYLKNKTIIVISHRFDNQELFDRVISLNKGQINEIKL